MSKSITAPLMIIVLDRGWVFVGRIIERKEDIVIDDASCVRYWGTKKGLGELAASGPLRETKLDKTPRVRVSAKALLFTIECDGDKWKNYA